MNKQSEITAPDSKSMTNYPRIINTKPSVMETVVRNVFAKHDSNIMDVTNGDQGFFKRIFSKSPKALEEHEIEPLKTELVLNCLTHVQDTYRVHLNRMKGINILQQMIEGCTLTIIPPDLAVHMTWAALSCVHHFMLRLKSNTSLMQWIRRRQARKAVVVYDKLLMFFLPDYYSVVLNAIISFYDEANIWEVEFLCSSLLQRFLIHSREFADDFINEILTLIENSTLTSSSTSRQILQVLYDVLESQKWTVVDDTMLQRFLEMYYNSVTPENNNDYNYEPLEKGLESCLRSMAKWFEENQLMLMIKWMLEIACLEEISDDNLLNFGSLLENVSAEYNARVQDRLLPERVYPQALRLVASDNLLYSLLGNRVLHNLTDRCNNKLKLDTPRIFFRNSHYNVVLNSFSQDDKEFFRRYRELLHKIFVTSLIKHGVHKVALENIYISMVLFLVEIPCGYTAAAAVCLAMGIQEAALEDKSIELTHAHCLHALVVSMMSLVCYIHHAEVFYDYVDTIIERRANFAPHLNPPIKSNYKYAQHHVLWNKPELFFEDWEVRYGLWKCFKNKRADLIIVPL